MISKIANWPSLRGSPPLLKSQITSRGTRSIKITLFFASSDPLQCYRPDPLSDFRRTPAVGGEEKFPPFPPRPPMVVRQTYLNLSRLFVPNLSYRLYVKICRTLVGLSHLASHILLFHQFNLSSQGLTRAGGIWPLHSERVHEGPIKMSLTLEIF